MSGRNVVLGVCGGIAAYKACEVLRGLQGAGCDVRVVMSEEATRFVGAMTFEALSTHPVVTSLFGTPGSPIPHIELADFADLCVLMPATANMLAKMSQGIADDALSTTLVALDCPVLVAPAMNTRMWNNVATQANVSILKGRGAHFVSPGSGRLACGEVGQGKLASVDEIVAAASGLLSRQGLLGALDEPAPNGAIPQMDLLGTRLLVTAGPTHEAIDPVRYIANSSTGKMGYAIARRAAQRGARVTLVSGPTSLETPEGVRRLNVVSAQEMLEASLSSFEGCDAAVCSAAVADYTPAHPADHKLKKGAEPLESIELVRTQDILATLCDIRGRRPVIGFAAETDDLIPNARAKLARKGASLIVANDVSRPDSTFGADTSRIALVGPDDVEQFETQPLDDVAEVLLDRLGSLLAKGA
ncbi:bifunctional phosphopantothenoylcysteine decarboxylase/phosphopantothenate--cysteine ligase CoaBC [Olsenella urininfantis]|uniref:bifunctional phosphopantothenoylcysteine decarboxylase/phosphopantothenate--cysteine ligase CoaBC n=1 Tax=Olsenella urininfantis TaxID=1871033 RepID=UPI000985DCF5|nr:bifunctional phosphopantothenoylcysteine decarboxylase/phosphopantothenate--cysteine ligase CoaBC [Olsenella urininfantis]